MAKAGLAQMVERLTIRDVELIQGEAKALPLRFSRIAGITRLAGRAELVVDGLHPDRSMALAEALLVAVVLAELAGFGVAHGHPGIHGASVGALI